MSSTPKASSGRSSAFCIPAWGPLGLLILLGTLAAGCGKEPLPPTGKGSSDGFSLQGLAQKMMPTPPKQQVAMMFDVNDPDKRRQGIEGLSSKSSGLKEPYLKAYATALKTDRDPLVRSAAVRALGKAGDVRYLSAILAALGDEDMAVRWDAAVALDTVTGEEAIDPLLKAAVEDSCEDVRLAAIRALRHYNKPRVITTLVRCLAGGEFSTRNRAHEVLVTLTGKDKGTDPGAWLGEQDTDAADKAAKTADAKALGKERQETAKEPWWKPLDPKGWRLGSGGGRAGESGSDDGPEKSVKPVRRWRPGDSDREEAPKPGGGDALLGLGGRQGQQDKPGPPVVQPEQANADADADAKRPWWDWLGVSSKEGGSAQAAPKPRQGPVGPAPQAPKGERPWWDWLGMTDKGKGKDTDAKAGAIEPAPRARMPAPGPAVEPGPKPAAQAQKPSAGLADVRDPTWGELDGMSPGVRQSDERKKDSGWQKSSAQRRPWWDWFGITDKDKDQKAQSSGK